MSVIVYDDVILDERVFLAGATGSQNRVNDRSVNQGGYATVNAVRDWTQRQFNFGAKPMLIRYWDEIEGCYEVTDAGAFGFLVKDPKDQAATQTNAVLQGYMIGVEAGQTGVGTGVPTYGFRKLYKARSSTRTKARPITRPNGVWTLYRNGVAVTVGVAPGNVSLSAGPVYATFVADQSQTVTAITVGATTQVTLNAALTGVIIGGRLWLDGVTGADAALLNNMAHPVTNVAGAVYTISTNTAGKTITAAGNGRKYPQPTDVLTWDGEFYVPVQFASDVLDWDIERPGRIEDRLVSGPTCTLLEIREA